ncbi:cytochrome c biogenesis protein DipZ [Pseudonocardia sp. HH130629-09]|uniref:cytochrome c biogenesis protein DipZ n=1 Tax=Pseudonocardia sp. HH130629-09 TaxID=1641402 RepID=UPI0006CB50F7|nr:cytochrome c biogenesis protein DipZ [Pseudonocardia sp. HH130629-09]ALE85880.1 thiol:disulfide interchange protein [Pseudonocardia sp. HH130629-09]
MLTLVLIGLVGGLITGISPCILPVLPVIFFAGGTSRTAAPDDTVVPDADGTTGTGVAVAERRETRRRRNLRPYAVIAGLVVSFSFFTLAGSLLISLLGLPADVLRIAGLTVLVLIGLGLIFPRLEELLEKPFSRIPQRAPNQEGGAFVLGLGLGLLYVPCAGPVLTAITVAGATGDVGLPTVALTLSFAVGATLPLLVFALAGRRASERVAAFRTRARLVRAVSGVVMLLLAVALAFNLQEVVQRAIPDYTAGLQKEVANNDAVREAVAPRLSVYGNGSNEALSRCADGAAALADCGPAPDFAGVTRWFDTARPSGLTAADLRGKVTLIDFWTYSCINCQRSIPHVKAWDTAYRSAGLQVVGIHTPEFAFEKDPANVAAGIDRFGITYPVAMDNDYRMFSAYRNQYWPARFLIDGRGTVRAYKLGEGDYDVTETQIRQLLQDARPDVTLAPRTDVDDATVTDQRTTRETYLNSRQIINYQGARLAPRKATAGYVPSSDLPKDAVTIGGTWTSEYDHLLAGPGATIDLHYAARNVYVVLGGSGTATVEIDGVGSRSVPIDGPPRIYPLIEEPELRDTTLHLGLSEGLTAYVFTFG